MTESLKVIIGRELASIVLHLYGIRPDLELLRLPLN
jgi:hypothetical protein